MECGAIWWYQTTPRIEEQLHIHSAAINVVFFRAAPSTYHLVTERLHREGASAGVQLRERLGITE